MLAMADWGEDEVRLTATVTYSSVGAQHALELHFH